MGDGSSVTTQQTDARSLRSGPSAEQDTLEGSSSRPLLRFETESVSDSETASRRHSGHYGFPGNAASPEPQPRRRDADQQHQQQQQQHRLSRFLSGGMSAADRAHAASAQAPLRSSGGGGTGQAVQHSGREPAEAQHRLAGLRMPPRDADRGRSGPAADAAAAATAAAAPIVAAAAAAAAAGNVAAGRVYHALYRGAPASNASASGQRTPDLIEPLVPGQAHAARSVCSDAGTDCASLLQLAGRMSRAPSHRSLTGLERQTIAARWAHMRNYFVLWLVASALTLVVSWWWFPLGILVGASGVLGSTSALRHKEGIDLTKPAGGVQLLGVLTGLFSACATAVNLLVAISVRCSHIDDCARLRVMLVLTTAWFGIMTAISATCAYFAYGLLQKLRPTVYMRQSDVAVPEAEDALSPALLRQETFTPRAGARMDGGRFVSFCDDDEAV